MKQPKGQRRIHVLGITLVSSMAAALAFSFQVLSSLRFFPVVTDAKTIVSDTGSTLENARRPLGTQKPEICFPDASVHIFMYHYVRDPVPKDAKITVQLSVPVRAFEGHMKTVRELADSWKIAVVSLPDLQKYREWNCYPNRNVFVFTDDDGWIDAYAGLAPIAKKYAVPFSFGIIASRLGAPGFVSAKEVAALARDPLFSIASHSVSHSDQDAISEPAERREICESKIILERLTGKPVAAFVYPAGRMSVNSSKILRECGYDLAFTTHYGAPWKESKTRYDINRTRVYPETKNAFFEKLADFR